MKLFAKNLNWLAGRPVVIVSQKTAEKLNVHVNDRIYLIFKKKKFFAVVDIFSGITKPDEIGLSHEVSSVLKNKQRDKLDVGTSDSSLIGRLIKKKMEGHELSEPEIKTLVKAITSNDVTESEISYFVSAEKIKGMSTQETVNLTKAMVQTGKKLVFDDKIIADKHCIGGIAGNRTTPIVVSICVAAGLKMPKSSSRAITSASGTADVIETIARVDLSAEEIKKVVNRVGGCLVWGGSLGLAPSDDKIIHVERILNLDVEPQLIASILSKKISAGSNHILIDIPYGSGKMKTKSDAKKLGKQFKKISKHFNIKVKPVYTLGVKPIGNGFGPVLEMKDVISVLRNDKDCPQDLKDKSIYLASKLMSICGISFAKSKARKILESGKAYAKFKEIINAQNREDNLEKKISSLKLAKYKKTIYSNKEGIIGKISNEKINALCRILGTPETNSAGVYVYKKEGQIKKGDSLMTLYSESSERLEEGFKFVKESVPMEII